MRLIRTSNLELVEYMGLDVPPYVILSHMWDADEVTFQDMQAQHQKATQMAGFKKMEQCAKLATLAGYEYIWIDTCCIDKRSSAELSEALNAMSSWYQGSAECFAYLADVPPLGPNGKRGEEGDPFLTSRWFTRGWTLQELIAPANVRFFANNWTEIGTKLDLLDEIHEATKIDKKVLLNPSCLPDFSVAQRMSWAATRETTRVEDKAYCLLGLFGIKMPMRYGEGVRAFECLQLEIIQTIHGHSILA